MAGPWHGEVRDSTRGIVFVQVEFTQADETLGGSMGLGSEDAPTNYVISGEVLRREVFLQLVSDAGEEIEIAGWLNFAGTALFSTFQRENAEAVDFRLLRGARPDPEY